jgi:hypothetical protein
MSVRPSVLVDLAITFRVRLGPDVPDGTRPDRTEREARAALQRALSTGALQAEMDALGLPVESTLVGGDPSPRPSPKARDVLLAVPGAVRAEVADVARAEDIPDGGFGHGEPLGWSVVRAEVPASLSSLVGRPVHGTIELSGTGEDPTSALSSLLSGLRDRAPR